MSREVDLHRLYSDALAAMRQVTTEADAPYAVPAAPPPLPVVPRPCPAATLVSHGPQPDLCNAFISVGDPEPAELGSGPLAGAAMAVKDNIDARGFVTTCGSGFYGEAPALHDARVVRELKAAGARCVGKTNLGEFALDAETDNPHFGRTLNPLDHERIAGGSSGGSGAAVASGQVALALGTDSGGSVRIPAAACGVVGYKPSVGALALDGVHGPAWTLDTIGLLARTVGVVRTAMSTLSACVHPTQGQRRTTIGFVSDASLGHCQPQVWDVYEQTVERLRDTGVALQPLSIPGLDLAPYVCAVTAYVEIAEQHAALLARRGDDYGDAVLPLLRLGALLRGTDYIAAQRIRSRISAGYRAASESVDLVLTPTLPVTAPRPGVAPVIPGEDSGLALFALIRFTCLANLLGLPAATIPAGCADDGLPVGVQLIGGPHRDLDLLETAEQIETHLKEMAA